MGLKIMFVDHPMRKQAVLDKKLSILHCGHTGIVSKGLTTPTKNIDLTQWKCCDFRFRSKIGNSSQFVFGQNEP